MFHSSHNFISYLLINYWPSLDHGQPWHKLINTNPLLKSFELLRSSRTSNWRRHQTPWGSSPGGPRHCSWAASSFSFTRLRLQMPSVLAISHAQLTDRMPTIGSVHGGNPNSREHNQVVKNQRIHPAAKHHRRGPTALPNLPAQKWNTTTINRCLWCPCIQIFICCHMCMYIHFWSFLHVFTWKFSESAAFGSINSCGTEAAPKLRPNDQPPEFLALGFDTQIRPMINPVISHH